MPSPPTAALHAAIWREVSRHLDLGESLGVLLGLARGELRVEHLAVRRWNEDRSELDTLNTSGGRTSVPTPKRLELLTWGAGPGLSSWLSREETGLARLLFPEGQRGPLAAASLFHDGRLEGVLLVAGEDARIAAELLREPASVALTNDLRLHELARLRERAESDKRALLARLERQDVQEAIVGADGGLRGVMERVGQVARTDAPVLILGETGSGKEVVARAVHSRSRRAEGPFLRVNCGAIPTELVDSELFGHERGSFTGAVALRRGWFERADGGTLFLDEVAELPAAAQVRLLRVLQDGSFQRVGGQETHTVDVRIIAATHRDMPAAVRDGAFREDLWYRVSVFPIRLPPLRERPSDIAPLAEHFAARAGERLWGRALSLTPDDLASLRVYEWPGNVRELAAVIERAAILGNGHRLDVVTALGVLPTHAPSTVDDRTTIEAALRRAHGRIEGRFGAAAALGVNPHTLRSRLRRLGIDWSRFRRDGA